jgi:hypothetical protein
MLERSGYKPYFWAREALVPGVHPEGTDPLQSQCAAETMYEYDQLAQRLANTFSATQPSSLCQNILMQVMCLHVIPLCDPEIDVGDEYLTQGIQRPCRWTCDLLTQQIEEFCTADDISYMKSFGMTFGNGISQFTPTVALNCASPFYSDDDDVCLGPRSISTDPVAARCEPYSGSTCSGVFGTSPVYIPAGLTQSDLENTITSATIFLSAIPLEDTSTCAADVVKLYCSSIFSGCSTGVKVSERDMTTGYPIISSDTETVDIAMPLSTPLYACESYVDSCSSTPFFQMYSQVLLGGAPIANCKTDSNYHFSRCFSMERSAASTPGTTWAFNTKNYYGTTEYQEMIFDGPDGIVIHTPTFSSKNVNSFVSHIPYLDQCPWPLVLANPDYKVKTVFGTDSAPTRCTFSCPTGIFTNGERHNIEVTALVLTTMSMVFSGILAITFTLFHSQRHKVILFWYFVSYFIAIFLIFLGLVIRTDGGSLWDFQCKNDQQYTHMSGFALFQGMFVIYFLCASTCWWMMLALDLFQRLILGALYRRGTLEYKKRLLAMHLFCWFAPLLIVVAALVSKQIGYDQYLPFALFAFDPNTNSVIPLRYSMEILFFILQLGAIFAGFIFIGVILVYLIRYDPTEGLKKFNDGMDKSSSKWFKLQQVLKVFGFVLLVIPFIVILIIRTSIMSSSADSWSRAREAWGIDLLLSPTGLNIFTNLPSQPLPTDRPPVSFISLSVFGFNSPGFMMFILYFLLSTDIMGLWAGLFYRKLGMTCCQRFAKEDTNTGSDASTDSASQGSSSSGSTGKTAGSNDLFGGSWFVLTKRGQEKAAQSQSEADAKSSTPGLLTGSSSSSIPNPQLAAQRKGQLFKGFSKPTDNRRNRGFSQQPSSHVDSGNNTSRSDDICTSDIGIELTSVPDMHHVDLYANHEEGPVITVEEEEEEEEQQEQEEINEEDNALSF